MKLKTYRAGSIAAALALVKKDLGGDAVVLHTRSYKQGGFWGLWAKPVVEITAADRALLSRKPRPTDANNRKSGGGANGGEKKKPSVMADQTAGDLIRKTYAVAQAELSKRMQAVQPKQETQPEETAKPAASHEQLAEEMRTVKRMVGQMLKRQRTRAINSRESCPPDMPEKLFDQYLHLLEQEVTEELAEEVIEQVYDQIGREDLEDQARVRQAVLEVIAGLIPTDEAAGRLAQTSDGRPRTIALIGPTGVGKTTTIAKLCATFKLKQRKHIGLITLDTYRIAAVDQLKTYASIIGVPLHVVSTPAELMDAQRKCRGCDVVLIDTAGRSQRDDPRLKQLRQLIEAADPHEVHLVLSSTCSQQVMLETVERFSEIRTDRIIFTKLDEAVSFGVLLNVARKVNKRLSYITTGQEVPHHIEPGRPVRLAALVLGDKI